MHDILGPFEHKVRKLVEEHLELRKELLASMEANRALKQNIQTLLLEIDQLKNQPTITQEDLEAQQFLQDAFAKVSSEKEQLVDQNQVLSQENQLLIEERNQLLEALQSIQNEISSIQNNSDSFFQEYDQIKHSLESQQEIQNNSEQRIQELEFNLEQRNQENADLKVQLENSIRLLSEQPEQEVKLESEPTSNIVMIENPESKAKIEELEALLSEHELNRDRIVLENESLKIQLDAAKEVNKDLKEKLLQSQEFENQEKNTTIVESIAEDSIQRNEVKLKINEYIKEIDKCIAQLNE